MGVEIDILWLTVLMFGSLALLVLVVCNHDTGLFFHVRDGASIGVADWVVFDGPVRHHLSLRMEIVEVEHPNKKRKEIADLARLHVAQQVRGEHDVLAVVLREIFDQLEHLAQPRDGARQEDAAAHALRTRRVDFVQPLRGGEHGRLAARRGGGDRHAVCLPARRGRWPGGSRSANRETSQPGDRLVP